ncbi:ABC transporter permease [Streptomyces sp. NPDC056361]|uniref:ABC transporter permease n=1 Tax=Streptomyces sp. NPDC056361 TaxID=3345795 RepID=UPI0035DB93A5
MSTLSLKGPYWVTVRQYRRTLWLAAAAVVVSLAVIGGLRLWDAQTPDRWVQDGYWVPADENRGYETLRLAVEHAGTYLLLLPLLAGAFVAGPLVAREFESGTYKLSLTQSISPAAWLRAKLVTATTVAFLTLLALLGVFHIGWNRVSGSYGLTWSDRGQYEASGIVLFAYVLAAVAVGALIGQLVRRTLVAMAATGLVMGVVLAVLSSLRWSFLSVTTVTGPAGPALLVPADAYVTGSGLLTASGARFNELICWEEVAATPGADSAAGMWGKLEAQCQARHGVTSQFVEFHPSSHFWPTQLIEAGILLALAALTLYAAFRVLRARHA